MGNKQLGYFFYVPIAVALALLMLLAGGILLRSKATIVVGEHIGGATLIFAHQGESAPSLEAVLNSAAFRQQFAEALQAAHPEIAQELRRNPGDLLFHVITTDAEELLIDYTTPCYSLHEWDLFTLTNISRQSAQTETLNQDVEQVLRTEIEVVLNRRDARWQPP
jgi:hypothetical protein